MSAAVEHTNIFLKVDEDFHIAIAEAAQNRVLLDALQLIRNVMRQWIGLRLHIGGFESIALQQHGVIFRSIVNKDREGAREAMRAHLDAVGLDKVRQEVGHEMVEI